MARARQPAGKTGSSKQKKVEGAGTSHRIRANLKEKEEPSKNPQRMREGAKRKREGKSVPSELEVCGIRKKVGGGPLWGNTAEREDEER